MARFEMFLFSFYVLIRIPTTSSSSRYVETKIYNFEFCSRRLSLLTTFVFCTFEMSEGVNRAIQKSTNVLQRPRCIFEKEGVVVGVLVVVEGET